MIEGNRGNIELDTICGNCQIIKAHENDSVANIIGRKKKSTKMAYVCRYKLVKETTYKLVPVCRWSEDDETGTEMSDVDVFTDNEDQKDLINIDLSAQINKLHVQITNNVKIKQENVLQQLVSPIKISNNKVHRVPRSQLSPNKKRVSPDANKTNNDISPTKRNKLNDLSNFESPDARRAKYQSPEQKKMSSIKKNLTNSFADAPPKSTVKYTSKINSKEPLKLKFTKGVNENTGPNTNHTPIDHRRSILKAPDSAKSKNILFILCFLYDFLNNDFL